MIPSTYTVLPLFPAAILSIPVLTVNVARFHFLKPKTELGPFFAQKNFNNSSTARKMKSALLNPLLMELVPNNLCDPFQL